MYYDKVLQRAEQQCVRARQMKEEAREMFDRAVEMRVAERCFNYPWTDVDIRK